jgi:hypothetical protein
MHAERGILAQSRLAFTGSEWITGHSFFEGHHDRSAVKGGRDDGEEVVEESKRARSENSVAVA